MALFDQTNLQKRQIKFVDSLVENVKKGNVSLVEPVEDFETDPRICLTSVHFPKKSFIDKVFRNIISPLRTVDPSVYFYRPGSLHITIKNIKTIKYPPSFSEEDIVRVKDTFSKVIPKHKWFNIYPYRLVIFPYSLSLIGTTDPELGNLFWDLDKALQNAGIPDDKIYASKTDYCCNMTVARFTKNITSNFKETAEKVSGNLYFEPYTINSITLVTANAVMMNANLIKTWKLSSQ